MNVIGLTSRREKNMRTLANFLLTQVPDERFDMAEYVLNCGKAGCAIGWAPVALGIDLMGGRRWEGGQWWGLPSFADKHLVDSHGTELMRRVEKWCFSLEWKNTDNSPQGAAKRILWVLDQGLPEDWKQQMHGAAPLRYNQEPLVELPKETTTHHSTTPTNLLICCAADK